MSQFLNINRIQNSKKFDLSEYDYILVSNPFTMKELKKYVYDRGFPMSRVHYYPDEDEDEDLQKKFKRLKIYNHQRLKTYRHEICGHSGYGNTVGHKPCQNNMSMVTYTETNTQFTSMNSWNDIMCELITNHNDPNGVFFDNFLDVTFGVGRKLCVKYGMIPYTFKWMGIIHYPFELSSKLFNDELFKKSLDNCIGLIVMSPDLADKLRHKIPSLRIEVIKHPYPETRYRPMNLKRTNNFVTIGKWYREELPSNMSIEVINQQYTWKEYIQKLQQSIVVILFRDCVASNVVLDCIIHRCPIIVNPHPSIVHYLGEDYPLYLDEQSFYKKNILHLASNIHVTKAIAHLSKIDVKDLEIDYFSSRISKYVRNSTLCD